MNYFAGKSVFTVALLVLTFCFGCTKSTVSQQFDGSQILIALQKVQDLGTGRTYTYRVANRSKYTLKHARLFVSFDLNQNAVSRQNPFKVELISGQGSSEVVKPGQEVIFSEFIPVKELFPKGNLFDFNGPNVELSGYVIQDREEIPFAKNLPPVNIRLTPSPPLEPRVSEPDIYGEWEWIQTTGGIAGVKKTPDTEGYSVRLIFSKNRDFKYLKNGSIVSEATYQILKKETVSGERYVVCYSDNHLEEIITFSKDRLYLQQNVIDGFASSYIRVK